MKFTTTLSLIVAISTSTLAFAQSGNMKGMNANSPTQDQSMDMKNMGMKNMGMSTGGNMGTAKMGQAMKSNAQTHTAVGVVKAVDHSKNTVTIAHGPVAGLKWPAMAMTFVVSDKKLFDKLAIDKKVSVEFSQHGSDYVINTVR